MIWEYSAGIIPFSEQKGKRTYLLLLSNLVKGELWEFPKGQIEKGEDSKSAAIREFQEETGISEFELLPDFKVTLKYFYQRDGNLIGKTVTYFLAKVKSTEVTISHESKDYSWVTFEEAQKKIKHKNLLKVLEQAENFLQKRDE